jgi:hypothetical protein
MRLLDYLKQMPIDYNEAVYRLSGYTEEEIEQLPPNADQWLGCRGDGMSKLA